MRVITAPNTLIDIDQPTIFLAGAITNCAPWQDVVIEMMEPFTNGILLNPRRQNFPINDPAAAKEQIAWEFHALNNCDIFSIWFTAGESVQPICLYELGRHLALRGDTKPETVVVGIEPGYRRYYDVFMQTNLVNETIADRTSISLKQHVKAILAAIPLVERLYASPKGENECLNMSMTMMKAPPGSRPGRGGCAQSRKGQS